MNKLKSVTAFFPAYNDEGTIKLMVDRLLEVLPQVALDYEIIVVNDCSPDKSGQIADELASQNSIIKVVHHKKNKGYGGALRSGFANASKDWVFYTDGDAQYDVRELVKLVPYAEKYDVVNGFKIDRADGFYRKHIGNIYNRFLNMMFNLKVKDVDCDYRLIKTRVFNKVKLNSNDGSICLEMMKKIQNAGFTIKNIPVHHYDRVYGQTQFFKPWRIIRTLLRQCQHWFDLALLKKVD